MKTISRGVIGAALLLVALSPAGRADDSSSNSVRWATIIGIIQAGNVVGGNSTVSPAIPGITGGGQPWSTLGGHAYVDLSSGMVDFEVDGLVLAGGASIGTPDSVASVYGTLVCAPGLTTQAVVSTSAVILSAQGYAEFHGSVTLPTVCSTTNVAFLITGPPTPPATVGHSLANGAVRVP
jgi:hypothetical protein